MVAATSWLSNEKVVLAAGDNLSQARGDFIPIRLQTPNSTMIGR